MSFKLLHSISMSINLYLRLRTYGVSGTWAIFELVFRSKVDVQFSVRTSRQIWMKTKRLVSTQSINTCNMYRWRQLAWQAWNNGQQRAAAAVAAHADRRAFVIRAARSVAFSLCVSSLFSLPLATLLFHLKSTVRDVYIAMKALNRALNRALWAINLRYLSRR